MSYSNRESSQALLASELEGSVSVVEAMARRRVKGAVVDGTRGALRCLEPERRSRTVVRAATADQGDFMSSEVAIVLHGSLRP